MAGVKQLMRLWTAQCGACFYCGGDTWVRGHESKDKAAERLGIDRGTSHSARVLEGARATREHLVRKVDGGKGGANLVMACHACNVRRGETDIEQHRLDMLSLVHMGLHPTNRVVAGGDFARLRKSGLRTLRALRFQRQEEICG